MERGQYPGSRPHHQSTRRRIRPLPQGRRRRVASQEPLLGSSNVPGRPVVSPRGHVELSSSDILSYRPPQISLQSNNNTDDEEDCLPPIWFSHSRPQPSNRNPAPDLAWSICSHGCCCIQCVRTQEIGFSEDCGRFERMLNPGFYCLAWPYQTISGRLSLRVQQLNIKCETKTVDHVFLHITVALLYRVAGIHAYEAFYKLQSPVQVIQSCVFDVVRSTIPRRMTLDDVFTETDSIAAAVYIQLQETMQEYGYDIVTSLVTEISPNALVKASMNEIGASRRRKQAQAHQAEANKVKVIKDAEALAESDAIRGVGVARERQALAHGMSTSIVTWTDMDVRIVSPPKPKEIMELLLVTQYLDVLTSVGADHLQLQYDSTADTLRSLLKETK